MLLDPNSNKQDILISQVKSGTLFDNVLITDDPEYAKQVAEETWGKQKDVSCFYTQFFGLMYIF